MGEECELLFTALKRGSWVETRKPLFVPLTMPPVCLVLFSSRPILLSSLNGCDVALFLRLLISYNFPKSISSSAHDGFNV